MIHVFLYFSIHLQVEVSWLPAVAVIAAADCLLKMSSVQKIMKGLIKGLLKLFPNNDCRKTIIPVVGQLLACFAFGFAVELLERKQT